MTNGELVAPGAVRVTDPVYVPGSKLAGEAPIVIVLGAVPEAGVTVSQGWLTVAVQFNVLPVFPPLVTVTTWLTDDPPVVPVTLTAVGLIANNGAGVIGRRICFVSVSPLLSVAVRITS